MNSILILEDDVLLAMQWSRALSSAGYSVYVTHGAVEADKVFYENKIDLCIVDFMVHVNGQPSPDGGVSFLGKLGANERKRTKILGVSGLNREFSAVNAEDYLLTFGAQRFLGKPFSDNELIDEVTQMLA